MLDHGCRREQAGVCFGGSNLGVGYLGVWGRREMRGESECVGPISTTSESIGPTVSYQHLMELI